nr:hypothetical protein [uncultured Butyrivibrio sp.]
MAKYHMTAKELILTAGSSRGSQIKFFKDDYWYKLDETGPEGRAEELATKILECSDLKKDEYIHYEACKIEYEGKEYNGCRSKNVLGSGELLYSYEKIYELSTGRRLSEDIQILNTPKDKIEFVAKAISDFCGLDVREHIAKNLTVGMVLLNTDLHLNNIAVIANKDLSDFRNAPIFDNGASFLSNHAVYPPSISIADIEKGNVQITGKPFSANLEYQAVEAGLSVRFDFEKIKSILNEQVQNREIEIAKYLANKYEKVPSLNYIQNEKENLAIREMESVWQTYFDKPKNERNGIEWQGQTYRPVEFDDLYMACCRRENVTPSKTIENHFYKCIDGLDYTPKYYRDEKEKE